MDVLNESRRQEEEKAAREFLAKEGAAAEWSEIVRLILILRKVVLCMTVSYYHVQF